MKDKVKFLETIKNGHATVEFRTVNSNELRIMTCTLDQSLVKETINIVGQSSESEHFVVWSVDKNGWRSFRCNTVECWYDAYPEEKEYSEIHQ